MSNTNDFETGYQDDNTQGQPSAGTANGSTGFGTAPAQGKAVKKGSKLPLIIFGVVALVAIGGAAFVFLGGGSSPPPKPKPRAAIEAPADPTAADPSAADPAAAPATDPLAAQPGQTIDPITGLPVSDATTTDPLAAQAAPAIDPITGLPMDPAATSTDPLAADPMAADPMATAPAATDPLAADPVAPQPTSTVDPATGLPMDAGAPVATPDPLAAQPTAQPAAVLPAGTDPLSAFRDMLAPIDSRVTVLEGRVDSLQTSVDDISRKVDRLLDRPASTRISTSPAPKRSSRRASTPKPRAAESSNYVRPAEPRVQPPVSRVVIVSSSEGASVREVSSPATMYAQSSQSAQAETAYVQDAPAAASAPSCNLQAIVPGRVWVKNTDGSFASYGEGDRWNGQSVGTIDPARGVQVDGRWICN